jgi:hypothetical protein
MRRCELLSDKKIYHAKRSDYDLKTRDEPEGALKRSFASFVAKPLLGQKTADRSSDQAEKKQRVFRNSPAAQPSLFFVDPIKKKSDEIHHDQIKCRNENRDHRCSAALWNRGFRLAGFYVEAWAK